MKKAFTLVEILLVLLILAIVAASAVPSFQRSYARQKLSRATDDLVYLMRYARSRAVTEGTCVKLHIEGHAVSLAAAPLEDGGDPGTFTPVVGGIGRSLKIPEDLKIDPVPEDLLFYPDGQITPASFSIVADAGVFTISTTEMPGHVLVREEE